MKKKVSFLINSLSSGGAERVLTTIVNTLSSDYEIDLYTIQSENFYSLEKNINLFHLTNLKIKTNIFIFLIKYIYSFFSFFNYAKKSKHNILISALDLSNLVSIIVWKFILKRKLILWIHIDPSKQYNSGFYGFFFRFFIRFFYNYADKIVIVSKEGRSILISKFKIDAEKIITIYNPFDFEKIQELSNKKISKFDKKYFSNKFTFITIGRLSKQKGHDFLIRSFRNVVNENKNSVLLIFGSGELKKELIYLIKDLSLEDNVFLMGLRKNIFPYLKASNCFVLSSLWEGLPTVLIESLSLSVPIISTDCKTGPFEILCGYSSEKN